MKIRDGQIDVALLSGPRLKQWPTQASRVLSRHCSDAGLKVGWYGGAGLQVRGVLPNEAGGAVVMVEDAQKRLHRIQARAIVKVTPELDFPLPFQGWNSPGLIPESTTRKLMSQGTLSWQPVVLILGSGNRALKLGTEILENDLTSRVICLESVFDQVQGWEVEKRRFEIKGGRIIFGKPVQLLQKSPFTWELKVQDSQGVRVIDTARVISVGPFEKDIGYREYPAGSFLFEWENSESTTLPDDMEKILLDEHRAVVLASRIVKGLGQFPAEVKAQFEKQLWLSKQKLKEMEALPAHRFRWQYDGKWLSSESRQALENFGGTPKLLNPTQLVASIECIEVIGCRHCQKACPTGAIQIDRVHNQFLFEDLCSGCGFCLQACPSEVPIMIEGNASQSFTTLVFPYADLPLLQKGDRVGLLSRKGEMLVQSRVLDTFIEGSGDKVTLYKVEVPSHLIWEARSIVSLAVKSELQDTEGMYREQGNRVEVQIQGNVRRVKEGQNVAVSLFESGMARPNDILICEDGSCGLCQIEVDGVRKYACETTIHQGMSIRFTREHLPSSELCPCQGITTEALSAITAATNPDTLAAITQVSEVGHGKCHGLLCKKSWARLAEADGVADTRFNDWRFPWVDWVFK